MYPSFKVAQIFGFTLDWRDSTPKTCSPRSSLCPCDAVSWSEPPHVPSGYESTGEFTAPGMYWRDTEIAVIFWHNDTNDTTKRRELGLTTRLTRCEFQFSISWSKSSWWPDALFVTRFSALVWAKTGQIQITIKFSCTMQGWNNNLAANGRSKKVRSLCCHTTAPQTIWGCQCWPGFFQMSFFLQ